MVRHRYVVPLWFAVYALVGVLTFVTQPPGATELRAQFTGYLVAGAALISYLVLDAVRPGSRPVQAVLVVMAMASGFAAGAGQGENNCALTIASMAGSSAAYRFSPRVTWTVAGSGILAFESNLLIYGDGMSQLGAFLLQPPVLVVAVLLVMLYRSRRVQAEQSRALLAEQHRSDVLGERTRIAREIHDVLAHSLGALGIQIQSARAVLTDTRDIDKAVEILMTAQKMAAEGLNETRQAVYALRADIRPLDDAADRDRR